jgi:hypothetical protein
VQLLPEAGLTQRVEAPAVSMTPGLAVSLGLRGWAGSMSLQNAAEVLL